MALSKSETDATLLKVIVFPNTTQLPLYVGDALGIFARHGLTVERTITPTSTFQITKLAAGEFDIAIGAFDNIVAYQEGQGADLLQDPDLFAFMGMARMNLQLVVQPGIQSYADLKGKTFAVDAVSSGFVRCYAACWNWAGSVLMITSWFRSERNAGRP